MTLKIETRCIVCFRFFCCADCRWNHEKTAHYLEYDCPLCRGLKFLCHEEFIENKVLIRHIASTHLPLHCGKCERLFIEMDDFIDIDKCTSMSELVSKADEGNEHATQGVDERFDSIYKKLSEDDNVEAMVPVRKSNRTAVITPLVRKQNIVDYDLSDSDADDTPKNKVWRTPYPKAIKTPKVNRATPHVKKFMLRQKALDDCFNFEGDSVTQSAIELDEDKSMTLNEKTTPSRDKDIEQNEEMTTPTSHVPTNDRCKVISSAVTTSTPTHPVAGAWALFPETGADSPLSEIEGTTESPAQSIDTEELSKPATPDHAAPTLKSIIVTNSRIRLEGQDSSEKQITSQESFSNTDASSIRTKRVKFADDTVFKEEKITRIFRKPRRMLTPGPQRPQRFCFNPRFQAIINRFESQGRTMSRTPVYSRDKAIDNETPPAPEPATAIQARAINFKEDSNTVTSEEKESTANELFKSCLEPATPGGPDRVVDTVISSLTSNIAGSLQNCLTSALQTTAEETEIQFKFVITKRKVCVKKTVDDGKEFDEKYSEVERGGERNKENVWWSVAKAVKNVFWGGERNAGTIFASTTPLARARGSNESCASSASKRKCADMSDSESSPVNHKRHKFEGRIRGRPSIHQPVAPLRPSRSAEQRSLVAELTASKDETQNLSF